MARKAPPAHLAKPTAAWWKAVVADYELEPHHVRLLTLAAEAFDRGEQARRAIARDGAYFNNRFGDRKPHPALGVERDSRLAFARLLRELDLDGAPLPDPRPPRRGR
jgi:phage terminase small subunit